MANKTVDRKKAAPSRSQAAKASPKNASAKAARPSGTNAGKPSDLKPEQSTRAGAEVLEVEEAETEAPVADEEAEVDDAVADEVDEEALLEEGEEEEKPARGRAAKSKKARDLVPGSLDYSVGKPVRKSRLPSFPGSGFLYSSYRELRLVTWPSRRDTWNWSLVVVGVCVAVALVLGLADLGLSKFVTWWLSLAQ